MEDRGVEGDEGVHLPPPPQLREEVVPRRAPPGYGGGGSSSTSGPSRAGGSSSSGLFRASGSRGSGSTGQAAALAVQRSTVHIPPLARRPEYGRLGSSTLLLVNYFRFKLLKADDVYHYNVSIEPPEVGKELHRLIFNKMLETFGGVECGVAPAHYTHVAAARLRKSVEKGDGGSNTSSLRSGQDRGTGDPASVITQLEKLKLKPEHSMLRLSR